MSTSPAIDVAAATIGTPQEHGVGKPLLVCLPSMPVEAASATVSALAAAFTGQPLILASPDLVAEQPGVSGAPAIVPYPQPRENGEWVLTASDYIAAGRLAEERGAGAVLLLGGDAASLHPQALQAIQSGLAAGADLALPKYRTGSREGLVNSALLYPLTRALFAADIRFPLPLDAGLSQRMLTRLAATAQRLANQSDESLLWPVAEASVAGYSLRQVEGGPRVLPQPQEADLNTLFPAVTGSLFADLEAKAAFWQRARALPPRTAIAPRAAGPSAGAGTDDEIRSLTENFRVAFNNLREIWSLVLPPQTLLALKKLSLSPAESFSFAPALWARVAYDFALAFHLRTLNRGHLLGALTPLYLGWVASFLRSSEADEQVGVQLLEATAVAFEQEKPYLVSRWRWPDRFNP